MGLHAVDYRRGEVTRKLFSVDLPFKCGSPKIRMSPDGRVVALGLDHSIYVYSCEDGELMEAMEHVYQSKCGVTMERYRYNGYSC